MGFQVSPEHGKCNILVEVELSQRGQEKFMSMSISPGNGTSNLLPTDAMGMRPVSKGGKHSSPQVGGAGYNLQQQENASELYQILILT